MAKTTEPRSLKNEAGGGRVRIRVLLPTHLLWFLQGRGQQLGLLWHRLYRAGQHPLGPAVLPEATTHRACITRPYKQSRPACPLTEQLISRCQEGSQRLESKQPMITTVPTLGWASPTASCLLSPNPWGQALGLLLWICQGLMGPSLEH